MTKGNYPSDVSTRGQVFVTLPSNASKLDTEYKVKWSREPAAVTAPVYGKAETLPKPVEDSGDPTDSASSPRALEGGRAPINHSARRQLSTWNWLLRECRLYGCRKPICVAVMGLREPF